MITKIMTALNNHMNTFATAESITVAWEGVNFDPPVGAYLSTFLLPANSVTIGYSDSSSDSHRGIFQVTCIYPAGQGWGPARTMSGKIAKHFRRQFLTTGTGPDILRVKIVNVSEAAGIPDGGRYKIPVSITYVAFSKE